MTVGVDKGLLISFWVRGGTLGQAPGNMENDNSDDPFGFWNDEPTRPLKRTHAGTRSHGETQQLPATRMVPVVRADRARPILALDAPRNPLMTRVAVLAGILALIPVGLSLRSDKTPVRAAEIKAVETVPVGKLPAPAPTVAVTAAPTTAASTTVAPTPVPSLAPATEAVVDTPAPTDPPTTPAPAPVVVKKKATPKPTTTPAPAATAAPATAPAPPPTAVQTAVNACVGTYKVVAGDSWSGIASRAKVTMKALLAANNATVNTVLLPGKNICLPAGATTPAAPAQKPPVTTQPPATTQPATTQPPATTAPPSTQPQAPANTFTKAEVAQIIRDVWPDALEDEAIRIATRESNLIPTVHNACCYGLFQIYYTAHRTWLASIGVTSAAQLYDPRINASAALALYNIAGWAPWGTSTPTTTTTVAP